MSVSAASVTEKGLLLTSWEAGTTSTGFVYVEMLLASSPDDMKSGRRGRMTVTIRPEDVAGLVEVLQRAAKVTPARA